MSSKELLNEARFLSDTAYLVAMTLDLLIRKTEDLLNDTHPPTKLKHEKKKLFSQFSDYVKKACVLNDKITQDIYDAESANKYKYVQVWQEQANEIARVILLLADRLDDVDTVSKIQATIRQMPSFGKLTEELLSHFYLKK